MAGHHLDKASLKALDDAAREAQKALRPARERLPKLADALRQLPGVKTRMARDVLNELRDRLLGKIASRPLRTSREDIVYIEPHPGLILTEANIDDLFFFDDNLSPPRLTPVGASILLRLYDAGLLPTSRKLLSGRDASALRQFAESEKALRAAAMKEAQQRAATFEARKRLVADPASVSEAQFDYGLLNDIFIHHLGLFRGSKTMVIGGIEVTKEVRVYTSNRGKRQDSAVTFRWTGSDGQPHVLDKPSAYANNRRNDAERNWGLPE